MLEKIKRLQIIEITLTLEGYVVVAKSLCGKNYRFLIKDKNAFINNKGKWHLLPQKIGEIIIDKFINFHMGMVSFI